MLFGFIKFLLMFDMKNIKGNIFQDSGRTR